MAARRERRTTPAPDRKATGPIELDGKLDTTQARPLATSLLAKRGTPLRIDASQVAHLGALCAQVLLSARNTWAHDNQHFEITAASEGFGEGLRLLGLTNHLGVVAHD